MEAPRQRGSLRLPACAAWVAACLTSLSLASPIAEAHSNSSSFGSIVVDKDTLTYLISIPEAELNAGVPLDTDGDGKVSAEEVLALSRQIFDYLQKALSLRVADGASLARIDARMEPPPASVTCWPSLHEEAKSLIRVTLTYRIPPGARELVLHSSLPATPATPSQTHILKVSQGSGLDLLKSDSLPVPLKEGEEYKFALKNPPGGASSAAAGGEASTRSENLYWVWFKKGVFHILDWEAYDHLLFLAALIVVAPGLLDLLKIATAFTISHSISLALAVFHVVHLRDSVVEPAIALTIVYVSVENWWPVKTSRRWKVAFFLGLIHGLGFAESLADLSLTRGALAGCLVTFNCGVEVGQMTVLTAFFPLVAWLRRSRPQPSFHKLVRFCSVGIACAGFGFFIQRAFF